LGPDLGDLFGYDIVQKTTFKQRGIIKMSPESYVGTMAQFAGSYDPVNWIACSGQQIPINDYGKLHMLIKNIWKTDNEFITLPDYRPLDDQGNRLDWAEAGVPRICVCYEGIYPPADDIKDKEI
jgi:hypothetical protein